MENTLKLKKYIILTWSITTMLSMISLLLYVVLAKTLKFKFEYLDLILPFNTVMMPVILILFLTATLLLTEKLNYSYRFQNTSFKEYIPTLSNKKRYLIITFVGSLLVCLFVLLAQYSTLVTSLIKSNNVINMEGTVENIYSSSSKDDGSLQKIVLVKDSNGKEHIMKPIKKIESLDLNNGDKIAVDYFPSKYSYTQADTILKYNSQRK